MLFIRAARDDLGDLYENPADIWRSWADSVQEVVLDCGHHMAEEAPDELAAVVDRFLFAGRGT
jgi:haloacetate dehalogenase